MTLYGTGFVATSNATFGGQTMQVTYVTSTMITAIGNASSSQVGSIPVQVTNPAPGGGKSNTLNVNVTTSGSSVSSAAAVRFLEQSSFGPDLENVNQLTELGFGTYLQNQFAATVTPYPDPRPNDGVNNVQQSYFLNAIAGGDQLRMRTAFALNNLWVVSGNTISDPLGYTNYVRTLDKDALGNYRNLMTDVTLTPAMGNFLNMVDNDAPPPGEHANENYAREFMQLFTLGLNQLNPDGTPVLDSQGNPIPTYTQNDVMAMGRVLTGWTFPVKPGMSSQNHNPEYYGGPMVPVEGLHDSGSKTLLGQTIPAGQTAEADLAAAFNIVFNHPNTRAFRGHADDRASGNQQSEPGLRTACGDGLRHRQFRWLWLREAGGHAGDHRCHLARSRSAPRRQSRDGCGLGRQVARTGGHDHQHRAGVPCQNRSREFCRDRRQHGAERFLSRKRFQFLPARQSHCGNHVERTRVFDFRHELQPRAREFDQHCGVWLSGLGHHARFQRADQCRHIRPDGVVA